MQINFSRFYDCATKHNINDSSISTLVPLELERWTDEQSLAYKTLNSGHRIECRIQSLKSNATTAGKKNVAGKRNSKLTYLTPRHQSLRQLLFRDSPYFIFCLFLLPFCCLLFFSKTLFICLFVYFFRFFLYRLSG